MRKRTRLDLGHRVDARCLSDERESDTMEFFPDRAELSLNSMISPSSGNLLNHSNIDWAQFKDPVSHICLAGAVVASRSLTQDFVI